MKQQIIFIHGGDSFANYEDFLTHLRTVPIRDLPGTEVKSSWRRSLPEDLGEAYEIFMPVMPNSKNARYAEWKIWLERHLELVTDGVILIGWSLGGMFLAKYLAEENLPVEVKALYLLAAPGGEFSSDPKEGDCQDFQFSAGQAARLMQQVPVVAVWHSRDDQIVPVSEAIWYQAHVPGAQIQIFEDKNHFLVPELPELVEAIKSL